MEAQPVLIGTYDQRIDARGRLTIPAVFRQKIAGSQRCVIAPDPDGRCLFATYPSSFNDRVLNRLGQPDLYERETWRQPRFVYGSAVELVFDASGRIKLPTELCNFARIKKEVILVGLGNCFEIYDKAFYQAAQARLTVPVYSASAWTGIQSKEERAGFITAIGPHILREFSNWIEEWEARRGNSPPESLFPDELLEDLRILRDALSALISDIENGRFSNAEVESFVKRSVLWLRGYQTAVANSVIDAAYAAPTVVGVVGFAQIIGMLDHSGASLVAGILAGSVGTRLMRYRRLDDERRSESSEQA